MSKHLKLSKYPKRGVSYSQLRDEEKIVEDHKRKGIVDVCPECGGTKFMLTTTGLRICVKDYHCIGFVS